MHLSWRQRLHLNPSLAQIDEWPVIVVDSLPRNKQAAFRRNFRIVSAILQGQPPAEVAAAESISPARVSQILDRCLGGDDGQEPPLSQGLIPYSTQRHRQRRVAPSRVGERKRRGHSCEFADLLQRLPSLTEGLERMIRAKLADSPSSQRIAPQDLHGEFKRLLAEAQWPTDRYPYTYDSLAYESVRRYGQRLVQRILGERGLHSTRHRSGTAVLERRADRAYDRIQIDEHRIDVANRLHLEVDGLRYPLRLKRVSILVAVDCFSDCILGWNMALTSAPNQDDLLLLLANCLERKTLMPLTTPGLSYLPGAGFPSMPDDGSVSFGVVELDNAWLHSAGVVADALCDRLGATIHQSRAKHPLARALVESVFGYIATHASHRFAATSGTGPQDPRRESDKNRRRLPTCSLRTLEEALEVVLSEYNATPKADRLGLSPRELLDLARDQQCLRFRSAADRALFRPFEHRQKLAIHRPNDVHHQPHINFEYVKYTNAAVLNATTEKHLYVHYDRRDIRTVRAYDLEGHYLGDLFAPAMWFQFAHGVMLRRRVHQWARRDRRRRRDPLSGYFHECLAHSDDPAFALELLRVAREIAPGQVVVFPRHAANQPPRQDAEVPSTASLRRRFAAVARQG